MERVTTAVIGTGRIGRIHARTVAWLVPGAELTALSDVSEEALQEAAHEVGAKKAETDHRRVLEDPAIQAVIICSPTPTHAPLIVEAARAGKHIFCEKPIALDLPSIDRALQAVKSAGVKLMLGFNRRFDPGFSRARELIAAGEIGVPHILRITSRDPEPPPTSYLRESGGIFLDMMIHDFDMARFLMGTDPREVLAAGSCLVNPQITELGDVDTAVVMLRFPGGALGTIDNSRRSVYGYDQRVEVFGSEGQVTVGNRVPNETMHWGPQGLRGEKPLYFFLERYREAYVAEMEAFISCVLQDTEPPVGGEDGKKAAVLGHSARQSLAVKNFVTIPHEGSEK